MESVFNADFSRVRKHAGGKQAESIGALAFTTGSDIYFAQGQYNPNSSYGQRLLGHELTHVVQQKKGRVINPFGNGITVINDPGLEAEAERMGVYVSKFTIQPLMENKQSSPGMNNPKNNSVIQRLNLYIGAPENSGIDFPYMSAKLIENKTGDKATAYYSYKHPKPSFIENYITGVTKHTLYIVTHGAPDSIVGFNTASKLADSLKEKGLNSTNLSKIVLVACSTGESISTGAAFARRLNVEMGVEVYASTKTIDVNCSSTPKYGMKVVTPIKFTIDDEDVDIIEGSGLQRYFQKGKDMLKQSLLSDY